MPPDKIKAETPLGSTIPAKRVPGLFRCLWYSPVRTRTRTSPVANPRLNPYIHPIHVKSYLTPILRS